MSSRSGLPYADVLPGGQPNDANPQYAPLYSGEETVFGRPSCIEIDLVFANALSAASSILASTQSHTPLALLHTAVLSGDDNGLRALQRSIREDVCVCHLQRMLPVFYALLDDSPIRDQPTSFEPDGDLPDLWRYELNGDLLALSRRAALCLRAVHDLGDCNALRVPHEDLEKLWERSWQWVKFRSLHGRTSESDERDGDVFALHLGLIWHFALVIVPSLGRAVLSTPGLFILLGRAWSTISDRGLFSPARRITLGVHVTEVLVDIPSRYYGPEALELFTHIHGTFRGIGDKTDTARVVLSQLALAVPHSRHIVRPHSLVILRGAFSLMGMGMVRYDHAFRQHLLSGGVIARLVTTYRALVATPVWPGDLSDLPGSLNLCFGNLRAFLFYYDPSNASFTLPMRRALRRGILSAVLEHWRRVPSGQDVDATLRPLLAFIGPWLVYRDVLLTLCKHAPTLIAETIPVGFADRRSGLEWINLMSLVRERLSFVDHYDTEIAQLFHRECDEPSCDERLPAGRLKKCSACHRVYYCSKACQRRHWKTRHRLQCSYICDLHSAPGARFDVRPLVFRQEAFTRCMLVREHLLRKKDIAIQAVTLLCEGAPAAECVPCVFFDFNEGECRISVRPLAAYAVASGPSSDHVDRAMRKQLVHVLFLDSSDKRHIMSFPCTMAPLTVMWTALWAVADDARRSGFTGNSPLPRATVLDIERVVGVLDSFDAA
uniref:MYND-type domain-containing protein n=1 Tax=Mycena chlorophos TaxID=658473 RepID=A0ABQ0KUD7_MYCCL|nr:predicted protein [Mycena chlorophos]